MLCLPTTATAVHVAYARTADQDQTDRLARRSVVRSRRLMRALVHGGALPVISSPYPLRTSQGRRDAVQGATSTLKGDRSGQAARNDDTKTNKLPKAALSMASRKGRVTLEGIEHLVSSFSSQWSMFHRAATAFLPEKMSQVEAKAILTDLPGIQSALGPVNVGPILRKMNPGSGRAGGRPRKVRLVAANRWGARRATTDHRPIGNVSQTPTTPKGTTHAKGWGRGQEAQATTAPVCTSERTLAARIWKDATDEALSTGRARLNRRLA